MNSRVAISSLVPFLLINASGAGVLDVLGLGKKSTDSAGRPTLASPLSQDEMIQGLKEALGKGVQHAVGQLGHEGGFLTNLNVRIPMPEKLQTVEKTLRTLKQDKLVDDFVTTMNHAAEQAVPEAAGVFGDAIKKMSLEDAKTILLGTNNAATQYFRRTTETNLFEKILPIVKQATEKTGVTAAYKRVTEHTGGSGLLGTFEKSVLGTKSLDIDAYVTNKTLDGPFKMVAEEEKRIRENPVARTSDLLQRVFDAVKK
jgi:hypothetical protein